MLEMNVYDTYRQEDGKPYSYNYLLEQKNKKQKKKIKRIQQIYGLIAFAKFRRDSHSCSNRPKHVYSVNPPKNEDTCMSLYACQCSEVLNRHRLCL